MTTNRAGDSGNLFGTPLDLVGHWDSWVVKDKIRCDITLDDPELVSAEGIFLGFGSGNRKAWTARFQHLTKLKYLVSWTGNNTNAFFDAICEMTWLRRLCFGRLMAKDVSAIGRLRNLEYFCAFQSFGPDSLQPLMGLENLVSLELGLSPRITDISCFDTNSLVGLRSLKLASDKIMTYPTIEPLGKLQSLEYLSISSAKTEDQKLQVLLELPNLKSVHLAEKCWAESEVQSLKDRGIDVRIGFS